MLPKENVGTVGHVFVPKGPWTDRMEHRAPAPVIGPFKIDAQGSSIPIFFEAPMLRGAPQGHHVEHVYVRSEERTQVVCKLFRS
jgi:hypothetical protein